MNVSVVIPCYNEEKTLISVIEAVKRHVPSLKEMIIVDDASTDGTSKILENLVEDPLCKTFSHKNNLGKGAALSTAFREACGDILVIQDADLEYSPTEIPKLLQPILDNKADVVYGSRFVGGEPHRVLYFWHRVANWGLTLISNMLTNLNLTDMETGYKAFRKSIIDKISLQEKRFGIEPEITAKIAKLNCRVYEVGISYTGRSHSEGKKLTWKDGFNALYAIIRYNVFL